jgi:hypothetical protein
MPGGLVGLRSVHRAGVLCTARHSRFGRRHPTGADSTIRRRQSERQDERRYTVAESQHVIRMLEPEKRVKSPVCHRRPFSSLRAIRKHAVIAVEAERRCEIFATNQEIFRGSPSIDERPKPANPTAAPASRFRSSPAIRALHEYPELDARTPAISGDVSCSYWTSLTISPRGSSCADAAPPKRSARNAHVARHFRAGCGRRAGRLRCQDECDELTSGDYRPLCWAPQALESCSIESIDRIDR